MTNSQSDTLIYQRATFLTSAPTLAQCPEDTGIEVAFAGRSNAGKSSALNTITHVGRLAKTSKTPGRTQLINFFSIDPNRRLVDLPGYGYAKVSRDTKEQWQRHLEDYLRNRQALKGLVLVMDIRHPFTDFDQMMLQWTHAAGMPAHILLTKADKLGFGAAKNTLLKVQTSLKPYGDLASAQLFSSLKKQGVEEARAKLDGWFRAGETLFIQSE